ncbi:MAG: DUF305 domain-containing protein [Propionibacteriales bacterium]|nr:DUF305 domain-containing protein [Propionibacteriales bacterium]
MTRRRTTIAGLLLAALTLTGCGGAGGDGGAEDGHNDADLQFAQQMIPHHRQAVLMSDLVLEADGVDPDITAVAADIKAAQAPEIEMMEGWLDDWGVDSAGPDAMDGMESMDGMLSDDELAALGRARGAGLETHFLEGMIGHHEGAIAMAREELDAGENDAARDLAEQIIKSQAAEIETMKGLLEQ